MTAPKLDLDALDALASAATPEPWEPNGEDWRASGEPALVCAGRCVVAIAHIVQFEGTDADSAFIAAARTAVPALIAELRAARAQIAAMRDVATGKIQHTFTFACGSDVGDPECPACRAMGET